MKAKLLISVGSLLIGFTTATLLLPPNQLATVSPTNDNIAVILVPRSNHLDEYILLWSPYSNCCYYPLTPDYMEMGDKLLTFKHDFRMPAFGYWQVVKK